MSSGISSQGKKRSPELEIYLHARNINLLWRYEILTHNKLDPMQLVDKMEDDIFWDLAEIDRETSLTQSLRIPNMNLKKLPAKLSVPFSSKILDISNNEISEIPKKWFKSMSNLEILRIANNKFETIPWESISQLDKLKILDLRGNPWNTEYLEKLKGFVKMFQPHLQKIYL